MQTYSFEGNMARIQNLSRGTISMKFNLFSGLVVYSK